MSNDNKYGKEFLDSYVLLMGGVWRDKDEEASLLADPTAYAIEKGLPVDSGARVELDRRQPDGLFRSDQLVQDWTATPGVHILHIPAEELISESELTDSDLEMVSGGITIVIACFVA
jgi:hypothetical protein